MSSTSPSSFFCRTVAVDASCSPPANTQAPACCISCCSAPSCAMIGARNSGGGTMPSGWYMPIRYWAMSLSSSGPAPCRLTSYTNRRRPDRQMSADLSRFLDAQGSGTYEQALRELRAGRKQGHWIWFVFPQIAGLGRSPTSQHYALASLDEARDYLAHPVLGPRLVECAQALLDLPGDDAVAVLGPIDAVKLRSSMTLFACAAEDPIFRRVVDKYFGGALDEATLSRL